MSRGDSIRKAWAAGKYANRDTTNSGRPKGVKDSEPRVYSLDCLRKKVAEGKKLHNLMVKRGTIGWPKGVSHTDEQNELNSERVSAAIAEGRLNPAANIRKFIEQSDGTEEYWQTRNFRGEHGSFFSKKNKKRMYHDSSWELVRMKLFEKDESIVSYRRNPVRIPYSLNGKARYYCPDFVVIYKDGRHVLEEVKPEPFLVMPETKAKFKAARIFCKGAGLTFRVISTLEACHSAS